MTSVGATVGAGNGVAGGCVGSGGTWGTTGWHADSNVAKPPRPRTRNAARRFGPNELSRAFRVLAEADLMQKGGKTPPAIALENAIMQLTSAS